MQLRAIAIATFFLGVGFAGAPFDWRHALIAAVVLAIATLILEHFATPLVAFLLGFFGVVLTCYAQHGEFYPGLFIVAAGFGFLAGGSIGWRTAPAVFSAVGSVVGVALFFLR
jgi:hypothetical protein